jgi:ParB family chromosome partitioning protein
MASILDELDEMFPAAASETVHEISLDLISPDPRQPRKEFDSVDLDELALSIESNGVVTPILLRPDPDYPGHYLIVAGERRFRASHRARRTTIPALIREIDPDLLGILQLVDNIQRTDLRPLETARAIKSLLDSTPGLKSSTLASLLGKTPSWISHHLALLEAQGATREALAEGLLHSPETARLFQKLPEESQRDLLEEARQTNGRISRTAVAAAQPIHSTPPDASAKRNGRPAKAKTIPLPSLTSSQLEQLFMILGLGPVPPKRNELREALLNRLTP